uniref:Uncharacterized protein n=1 Tax=Tanacetum cinerariifolium TaxID=118510 RepID=A0A6L2MPV6_TANCI|nr:hypothetical protein [Tanacetum cinerariifolium]
MHVEAPALVDFVSCDSLYDWSNLAEEGPTNFSLMAYSSVSSNSEDVRKNFSPSLIEDWISDSEDENESKPKIEKKTVKPRFAKIEFVKSKEKVKTPRKTTVKQDYEEIDGGYFAFGGNLKGRKITSRGNQSNGNACTKACDDAGTKACDDAGSKSSQDDGFQPSRDDGKKVDEYPRQESKCKDQEKEDNVNKTNNVNDAGTNGVNVVSANTNNELPFDTNMPALEDISTFNFSSDHEDDDKEADMNNMDTTI